MHSAFKLLATGWLATGVLLANPAAAADPFPAKAITIIVPYAAGGPTDLTARLLAEGLAKELGVGVLVENKTGAATIVAVNYLLAAPRDGYTIMMAPGTTTSMNPHLYQNLSYKPSDLAAISLVTRQPFTVTASPGLPAKDIKGMVELAKSRPDGLTFGTTGTGSMTHIVGSWVGDTLGIKMTEVPYKGTAASTVDLIGNRLDLQLEVIASAAQVHNAGRAHVLGLLSDKRSELIPDVPTFKELGYPQLEAYTYFGLLAAAGTPPERIERLRAATEAVAGSPAFMRTIAASGAIADPSKTSQIYTDLLQREYETWGRIIKPMNIQLD